MTNQSIFSLYHRPEHRSAPTNTPSAAFRSVGRRTLERIRQKTEPLLHRLQHRLPFAHSGSLSPRDHLGRVRQKPENHGKSYTAVLCRPRARFAAAHLNARSRHTEHLLWSPQLLLRPGQCSQSPITVSPLTEGGKRSQALRVAWRNSDPQSSEIRKISDTATQTAADHKRPPSNAPCRDQSATNARQRPFLRRLLKAEQGQWRRQPENPHVL